MITLVTFVCLLAACQAQQFFVPQAPRMMSFIQPQQQLFSPMMFPAQQRMMFPQQARMFPSTMMQSQQRMFAPQFVQRQTVMPMMMPQQQRFVSMPARMIRVQQPLMHRHAAYGSDLPTPQPTADSYHYTAPAPYSPPAPAPEAQPAPAPYTPPAPAPQAPPAPTPAPYSPPAPAPQAPPAPAPYTPPAPAPEATPAPAPYSPPAPAPQAPPAPAPAPYAPPAPAPEATPAPAPYSPPAPAPEAPAAPAQPAYAPPAPAPEATPAPAPYSPPAPAPEAPAAPAQPAYAPPAPAPEATPAPAPYSPPAPAPEAPAAPAQPAYAPPAPAPEAPAAPAQPAYAPPAPAPEAPAAPAQPAYAPPAPAPEATPAPAPYSPPAPAPEAPAAPAPYQPAAQPIPQPAAQQPAPYQPAEQQQPEVPAAPAPYGGAANLQSTQLWSMDGTAEFRASCESRRLQHSLKTPFFMPHPGKDSMFIQCDDFGKAFIKACPSDTVFTENMACENRFNLLPIDQNAGLMSSVAQFVQESPEFESLCVTHGLRATGERTFYMAHPSANTHYIQCDAFGKAFVKACPAGTVFTENNACENPNHLLPTLKEMASFVGIQPGQAAFQTNFRVSEPEATEFSHACAQSKASMEQTGTFFMTHPTINTQYIQCDDNGKAYLRTCPAGTIFTENAACEKQADHLLRGTWSGKLNLDVGQRVPQFNQQCQSLLGSANVVYFAHPTRNDQFIQCDAVGNAFLKTCSPGTVFNNEMECVFPGTQTMQAVSFAAATPYSTNQQLMAPAQTQQAPAVAASTDAQMMGTEWWSRESPEFKATCASHRTVGVAAFYLAHPERRDWFIQCDESNRAFVKMCMQGTVFTENMACEREGEFVVQQHHEPGHMQTIEMAQESAGGEEVDFSRKSQLVNKIKSMDFQATKYKRAIKAPAKQPKFKRAAKKQQVVSKPKSDSRHAPVKQAVEKKKI